MDFLFSDDEMNNYPNYYKEENFEIDPYLNNFGVSYGNNFYFKDKMIFEAKNKKHKNKSNSIGNNNPILGMNNDFNMEYKITNFPKRKVKKYNFKNNNNYYNDKQKNFMNLDNNMPVVSSSLNNQTNNTPFIYQPKYPKKGINNNNHLNSNINNQLLRNNNQTLKKNHNFDNQTNNFPSSNNKNINHMIYHINSINNNRHKKQFPSNLNKNHIIMPQNINMNNNIILNNNINNNVHIPKKNNQINKKEDKNELLKKYIYKNKDFDNNNNIIRKDNKIKNIIQSNKKGRIIKKRAIEEDEDDEENLSSIAEDLFNICVKKNNKKIIQIRKGSPNNSFRDKIANKENKKKISNEQKLQPSRNKSKEKDEFGCQVEMSKSSKNSRHNNQSNLDDKKNDKVNPNPKTQEIGIGVRTSLLQFLQLEFSNRDNHNIQKDYKEDVNEKINSQKDNKKDKNEKEKKEEKSEKETNEKLLSSNDNNLLTLNKIEEDKKIFQENIGYNSERIIEEDSKDQIQDVKNSLAKGEQKINKKDNTQNLEEDFKLGEELIESDYEKEKTEKKSIKKDKRIKFDPTQDIYFNFLKNDIISACQFRRGILGQFEPFRPLNRVDIFDSQVVFKQKSTIKHFNKDEIKYDKNYKLRENMDEFDITPELFEEEENRELDENVINEIANSLRSSIDKSTDASVNKSLRNSISQSYNQSIINSLMASTNREGEGILRRLRIAFEESVNQEVKF